MPQAAEAQSTLKNTEPAPTLVVEKDLVVWSAPSRPFKRWGRKFYTKLVSVVALVGIVLFLIEGFMPVILLISLSFLFYVMFTTEPEIITYKVTNFGIRIGDVLTKWDNLTRFWFSRRIESDILIVETISLPGRLEYVIDPKIKENLKKALSKYIPEEEIPPSNVDKLSNWFSAKLVR